MDFFERQSIARKNTRLLVFYFALAILVTICAVYAATVIGLAYAHDNGQIIWWNYDLAIIVPLIIGFIIALGTSVRFFQLAQGGRIVATELGGAPLNPLTSVPDERKLRNVVEEMSIASGVPMPEIYLLHNEQCINAFAAGYKVSNATLGITRGAIEKLTRDELQGVIAHEFSHILNGDMKLNMYLSALTFGIMYIALTGKQLLSLISRVQYQFETGSSSDRKNALGNIIFLFAVGMTLCIVGSIGYLLARLTQAAICRQREFLADASAVQFTRNPAGIAGALVKIGRVPWRGILNSSQSSKSSHFLFASGTNDLWEQLFSTHPPIIERVKAIAPNFDITSLTDNQQDEDDNPTPELVQRDVELSAALGINAVNVTAEHLSFASAMHRSLPIGLLQAGREIFSAKALIYGLLLSQEDATRQQQRALLESNGEATVVSELDKLVPNIESLAAEQRLPLVNLVIPTLRHLSAPQYAQFIQAVDGLIAADKQFSLFEFTIKKILHHQLDNFFRQGNPARVKYHALLPLLSPVTNLIANLAYSGSTNPTEIVAAFAKGMQQLNITGQSFSLPGNEVYNLETLDQALDEICLSTPLIRRNILFACATTVMADNQVLPVELEVLRAIASVLDCPLPPFIEQNQNINNQVLT